MAGYGERRGGWRGAWTVVVALVGWACLGCESEATDLGQTRPFVLADSAEPPLAEIVSVYAQPAQYGTVEFSVDVISEDAGQDVQTALVIDHGDESGVSNGPYRSFVPGVPLAAATLADGPRRATIAWQPSVASTQPGCHTVTLIATHSFSQRAGGYYCPEVVDDVGQATWFVAACDPGGVGLCAYDDCPEWGVSTRTYCSDLE